MESACGDAIAAEIKPLREMTVTWYQSSATAVTLGNENPSRWPASVVSVP